MFKKRRPTIQEKQNKQTNKNNPILLQDLSPELRVLNNHIPTISDCWFSSYWSWTQLKDTYRQLGGLDHRDHRDSAQQIGSLLILLPSPDAQQAAHWSTESRSEQQGRSGSQKTLHAAEGSATVALWWRLVMPVRGLRNAVFRLVPY